MVRTGLPKYCNKCGKELIMNEVYRKYDIHTGQPVDIVVTLTCPAYRTVMGWVLPATWVGNGHFNKKIDIVDGKIGS
jgi:hypothetical protein